MNRPDADDWKACPPGELARLSSRLRSRRIRRNTARSGLALAVLTILTLGVWAFRPGTREMREFEFAGLLCSRVTSLARDYSMGRLEPGLRDQVKSHVDQCPRCHERFKTMGLISGVRPPERLSPDRSRPESTKPVRSYTDRDNGVRLAGR